MTTRLLRIRGQLLALALLCAATSAVASESYPDDIQRKLELDELPVPAPSCQLCHIDDEGGTMNVTKPFGLALMRQGAGGGNIPSLFAALDQLESEGDDSDGDGTPDIAELRAGSDPNAGEDGSIPMQVPLPQTGCSMGRAAPVSGAWVFALLGVLCLLRRRHP